MGATAITATSFPPNSLFSRFLTVFAVFSCEYFLAGTNVAVSFLKENTLSVILTGQVATWRLQKEKKKRKKTNEKKHLHCIPCLLVSSNIFLSEG